MSNLSLLTQQSKLETEIKEAEKGCMIPTQKISPMILINL